MKADFIPPFLFAIRARLIYYQVEMRTSKNILRIFTLCVAFVTGVSVIHLENVATNKVFAEPHVDNYELYTYSGSYYDSIDFNLEGGMDGELKSTIGEFVRPKKYYTYSNNGAGHLSEVLQKADEDPTNSNNMIYFYTRNSVAKSAATVNGNIIWNREHVWCQSLSGPDNEHRNWGTEEAGTDILHLRPAYESTNKSRGNDVYADLNKTGAKYYNDMLFGYSNGTYFEPIDSVKGDVARIIMYLWTTYTDYTDKQGNPYYDLDVLRIIESYDTLLKWHTMDQPDILEGNRNDYSESSDQKNRNPFVDHPELAWRIFGDMASSDIKNACAQAYPYNVEHIDPTDITLNKSNANIGVGSKLQLTASLEPENATGGVKWSSDNKAVATVTNGRVTAISQGSAVITARTSNGLSATCLVTVSDSVKIASYDFSSGNSSASEYNASALLTRFNNSVVSGQGLSNIVTSVIDTTKVYAGYNSTYYSYGLKFGTTNDPGTFTVALNKEVCKVVVNAAGWTATDNLAVGDANPQTPGVAYNQENSIKTLTYSISSSNSVSFTFTKRGFIQSIDFYAPSEVTTPDPYINRASSYAKLTANESITPGEQVTVTKTINQLVEENNWGVSSGNTINGLYTDFNIDENINITTTGSPNCGSIWGSTTKDWRLYQAKDGDMIISADNGCVIDSIKIKFNISNTGVLKYGEATISSNAVVNIGSSSSVTLVVGNSTEATNGQIKVTSISVTYTTTNIEVDSIALYFGASISKIRWQAINNLENYEITDYGIMMFRTLPERINSVLTVQEYYELNPSNVSIANKGSGQINPNDDIIDFMVKVNITRETSFRRIYCAAPFIVVNDTYYFLNEMRCSVNSLASDYLENGGSSLSARALQYLANTHPIEA